LLFVSGKAPWIAKTLASTSRPLPSFTNTPSEPLISQVPLPLASSFDLQDIATVLYLGSPRSLRISSFPAGTTQGQVQLDGDAFYIKTTHRSSARTLLTNWFRAQAQEHFTERTHYWSKVLKLNPSYIAIRSQKTRWGSCNPKTRALHFNWKVLMASSEIIDYLIVHELCHLRIPNHSSDFWQLVQSILPDYKERRKWLKQQGYTLNF